MRIGLDATRIQLPTGEGTYVRELIAHLAEQYPKDEFFVLVPEHSSILGKPNVRQIVFGQVDGLLGRLRYLLSVERIVKPLRLDIFHNLSNYGFLFPSCPVVTTVHDILTLKFPELRPSRLQWLLYKFLLPRLLKRATCIAASSASTVDDLKQLYGLSSHVRLTYLGYDQKKFGIPDCATVQDATTLADYEIEPGYVLFVGYLTPKKNIETVLRALKTLLTTVPQARLVIAGKIGHGMEYLTALIEQLGVAHAVKFLGYVPAEHLPPLYRGARVFVFPSIYEGFGLPVLEAMACGTPVLASNTSSLPEVVGNDAYLCPPLEPDCWTSKLERFYTSDADWQQASVASLRQAAKFSWSRCAEDVHRIYNALSPQSPP